MLMEVLDPLSKMLGAWGILDKGFSVNWKSCLKSTTICSKTTQK